MCRPRRETSVLIRNVVVVDAVPSEGDDTEKMIVVGFKLRTISCEVMSFAFIRKGAVHGLNIDAGHDDQVHGLIQMTPGQPGCSRNDGP